MIEGTYAAQILRDWSTNSITKNEVFDATDGWDTYTAEIKKAMYGPKIKIPEPERLPPNAVCLSKLPFETCVFEFQTRDPLGRLAKICLVCVQLGDTVACFTFAWTETCPKWVLLRGIVLVTTNQVRVYCQNQPSWVTECLHEVASILRGVLAVVQCTNVYLEKSESIHPSVNKHRIAKGKLPLFEYHTLKIRPSAAQSKSQGGTHSSPGEHLRRGHIRQLPQGNVWVNACIVNAGHARKVSKVYEVKP